MSELDRTTLTLRQVEDVKIMQKINAAHRVAWIEKFPTHNEHCLRLIMERLQLGLDKRDGVDPANPDTWRMTTSELHDLAQAAYYLNEIRRGF